MDKSTGAIYTPPHLVKLTLDQTLLPDELPSAVVCDPACGDGAFLVEVARRFLNELPRKQALERLWVLTGFDIDKAAVAQCTDRLNGLLTSYYPDAKVHWSVYHLDALTNNTAIPALYGAFTHIVGNPPYVSIQNMDNDLREKLAGNFHVLGGSSDLYIVFFELALRLVQPSGKVGLITPSSWIRTKAGQKLRRYLYDYHQIVSVVDFGYAQVFPDVSTYTMITVVEREGDIWRDAPATIHDGVCELSKGWLVTPEHRPWWVAHTWNDVVHMNELERRPYRLKDLADIHVGIQTHADEVYIMERSRAEGLGLEPDSLRPIVKASTIMGGSDSADRVVIYPYMNSGKLYGEDWIASNYPRTYDYLVSHKAALLERDKNTFDRQQWYAWGRPVSILSGFGRKIVTGMMGKTPHFEIPDNDEATVYSGYFLKPKNPAHMNRLLAVLNSSDMEFYIKYKSRPYRSGYWSFSKTNIENFPIGREAL